MSIGVGVILWLLCGLLTIVLERVSTCIDLRHSSTIPAAKGTVEFWLVALLLGPFGLVIGCVILAASCENWLEDIWKASRFGIKKEYPNPLYHFLRRRSK